MFKFPATFSPLVSPSIDEKKNWCSCQLSNLRHKNTAGKRKQKQEPPLKWNKNKTDVCFLKKMFLLKVYMT